MLISNHFSSQCSRKTHHLGWRLFIWHSYGKCPVCICFLDTSGWSACQKWWFSIAMLNTGWYIIVLQLPRPPRGASRACIRSIAVRRGNRQRGQRERCTWRLWLLAIILEKMRQWIATQENSVKMVLYLFGGYYSIVVSADAGSSGAGYAIFGHRVGGVGPGNSVHLNLPASWRYARDVL